MKYKIIRHLLENYAKYYNNTNRKSERIKTDEHCKRFLENQLKEFEVNKYYKYYEVMKNVKRKSYSL